MSWVQYICLLLTRVCYVCVLVSPLDKNKLLSVSWCLLYIRMRYWLSSLDQTKLLAVSWCLLDKNAL